MGVFHTTVGDSSPRSGDDLARTRGRHAGRRSSEAGAGGRAARWLGAVGVAVLALGAARAGAATVTYNLWQDTGTLISTNEGSTNVPATALTGGANNHRTLLQTAAQAANAANFRSLSTDPALTWTQFARIYLPSNYASAQTITAPSANIYVRGTATTDQIQFKLVDFDPAGAAGNGVVLFTSAAVALPTTQTRTAIGSWTGTGGAVAAGHRLVLEAWVRPNALGDQARIYINNSTTTQSTITVTETLAPSNTLNLANATTGEAATTLPPGGAEVALDAFTLATSAGTVTPSSITVTMPAGSAALIGTLTLENTSACTQATPYSTITNPASDAPSFTTFTGLTLGTTASNLWVCVTPKTHPAMAVPPGTQVAVTGQITAVAATGYTMSGTDTVSAARTIDNLSPGAPTGLSGTAGSGQVVVSWTGEPADADFTAGGEVVVLGRATAAPVDVPAEGTDYNTVGQTIGTSFVACLAAPGARTCTATGLTNGTAYYFEAFARDSRLNSSVPSATVGPITPAISGQITLANASTGEAVTTLAPGGAEVALDAFTLVTNTGTVTPSSITVTMPAGSAALIGTLTLENTSACTQTTPYSTITNPASDAPSFTTFTGLTLSTTASNLWVCVTPKTHAAMAVPPGTQVAVTGRITAVAATGYTLSGTDTVSAARTIDNLSTGAPTGLSGTAGNSQVSLAWTAEPSDADFTTGGEVVVLGKIGSAPTDKPVEGTDYNAAGPSQTIGTSFVACLAPPGAKACTAGGLTSGSSYYFVAFARDASLNNSIASASAGPYVPSSFIGDGDPTPDSVRPVVSIINPMNGAVLSQPTRVQVRVFSPNAQPLSAVNLLVDGAAPGATVTAVGQQAYPGSTTGVVGVWAFTLGSVPVGPRTLRATATNAAGIVYSGTISVTIAAAKGDGNLLVRDNSSQLCSDCHPGTMSHSSENTGSKLGSWATTCRDCHTPHRTTNIALIKQQIKPPERTGSTTSQPVRFLNRNGFATDSFATTGTTPAQTGVCEVCHTKTAVYQADALAEDGITPAAQGTHSTGNCSACHKHTKGLGASCTACHGDATETRTAAAGADSKFQAAPPIVSAAPNPVPNVFVTNGGEHLKHVTLATYRSAPLLCNDCHTGASHQTTPTVQIGYSAIAKGTMLDASMVPLAGNLASTWTGTAPTHASANCTNWCHGDGLAGGGRGLAWNWATAQATTCSSCHGQATGPVAMPNLTNAHHPQNAACANCHGAGYATTGLTSPAIGTHIDGTVQHGTGCRACHGVIQPAGTTPVALNTDPAAAPGFDATAVDGKGNTARTFVGVGAHIKHVNAGLFMSGKCAQCHAIPVDGTITHADGALAWSWTAIAGVTPSYTAGTCTNYCHSNAAPLGGTVQTQSTISWTSTTTPMGCTTCHQTAVFGGTGLSTRHQKHVAGTVGNYSYTCDECHAPTMANNSSGTIGTVGKHVDAVKDVDFSTTAIAATIDQSGGAYAGSPGYTCTSTYCHSGGVATASPFSATASAAIAWNSASATTCQTCHGFTSTAPPTIGVAAGSSFQGSPAHMNHVANASVIGTNYVCGACHQNTVAAATDSPISAGGLANHVNGVKDVSIAPRGARVTTQTYVSPSCVTTYCHSSGQRTATFVSAAWNSAAWLNKCNGCHGTGVGNTTGAPDYANGGINNAASNSHAKHVGASTDCAKCHSGLVDAAGTAIVGSSHTNGSIEASIATGLRGSNFAYVAGTAAPASATCAGITCHGNNATAVVWGGPAQTCSSCHGTTGVEVDDLGANFWNNGVAATINTTEWTYSGHGKASLTYDVTGNPAANFLTTPTAGTSECMFCHDSDASHYTPTNPFRLRGVTNAIGVSAPYDTSTTELANATCLNCHSATANGVDPDGAVTAYAKKVATLKSPSVHGGGKHTIDTLGGKFCWDCHDPHGDRPNNTTNNVAMLGKSVTAVSDGTYGYVGAAGVTRAVTYNSEAASPPAVGKAVEGAGTGTQRVGVCQACHAATNDTLLAGTAWTKYWNRLGYDDTDGVGGAAPVSSVHNSGSTTVPYCISCHTHATGFGGECTGCHATTQTITKGPLAGTRSRRDVVTEFRQTWSHKASTNATPANRTVSNADCAVCHMEANSPADATPSSLHGNGYLNLRDPDLGTEIQGVTFAGTPGAFTSTGSTVTGFGGFSRDLAVRFEADPSFAALAAIQANQCLKCHDSDGALSPLAQVPTSLMPNAAPWKPFGTTIAGNGYLASAALTACLGAPPAWSATVTYSYGMWVNVTGAYYEATNLTANLNKPPASSPTYWTAAAAYAATTTYPSGDWVTVGGIFYRSLQSGNLNNAPASSPAWWQVQNPIDGCVTNVAASFATSNSSYHPIMGKQNNSYAANTRMAVPWNMTKTTGNNTSWGYLMSCWDCHALPTDSGIITKTITAHGGTDTIRGTAFGSGASNPSTQSATLCIKCHAQYDTLSASNHGAGSAFSNSGNSGMTNALKNGCSMCHGGFWSGTVGTTQVRPLRAEDVHGFDALPAGGNVGTRKTRWLGTATGTPVTVNTRPYAFIRNTYVIGQHSPKSAVVGGATVVYSPGCSNPTTQAASNCGSMGGYTVGGVY